MRHYQCRCGNVLFYDNSFCFQCGTQIGYVAESDQMIALDEATPFTRCKNGVDYSVCNWVVPTDGSDCFCRACRFNRTIPDLSFRSNIDAWRKVEVAKRRILYALARLHLFPQSKTENPAYGLAFDLLRPTPNRQVLTGHENGLITMNIAEAEDSVRERQRGQFCEGYRTLVGHFRHEVAHYYWDRFFQGRADSDPFLQGFREVFGDERQDYLAALSRHYAQGPVSAVPGEFISAYASAHPWEDWAETWAHYLHMLDGIETAENFGLKSDAVPIPFTPFPNEAVTLPAALLWNQGEELHFLSMLQSWARLAPAINEIVASLGHQAFYPFVFSTSIIRKLYFVHYVVQTIAAEGRVPGLLPDLPPVEVPPPTAEVQLEAAA